MDFDIIYPPKGRLTFDGGKNNKFEKYLIEDNESPDSLNCIYENGAVETRLGSQKFNSTAVGSYVGEGLYTRHTNGGQQSMCAWWNGSLYVAATNTFTTIPSAVSVFTAGGRVGSAEYENYIFFGNGGVPPYKYNGDFTRHGIYPPTTTLTVASASTSAGTIATGAYIYGYTTVNTNLVESDLSPLATTLSIAGSGCVAISNIQTFSASYGVSARRIYRSKTSSTTMYRVATINNNTATTYVDTTSDVNLGAQAPDDNGVPPKYTTIITHQTRLFCNDTAEPNLVWYSEIDTPYIFKSDSNLLIGDNSGETVKGFSIHDNGLLVFTENQTYLIDMPTTNPTDWSVIKLLSPYGSKSPFGIANYNDKQLFPAIQNSKLVGFAAISGNTVDPEATFLMTTKSGSQTKSDRIEPDVFQIQSAEFDRVSAIVYKNKIYFAVTYGTGATANNRIYVFDFSISNLSKDQEASWEPWTGLNVEQMTIYNGVLYGQDSTATGFVRELNKSGTYSDDGTAINSYHWTKEYSGLSGEEQFSKDFRYTNILYEKAGGYYMDLFYRTDSDLGDGTRVSINLNPGSSLWGTMMWGRDNWGGGNAAGEEKIFLGQLRGKRIQFKFSNQNTASQKFKVYGQQFGYNDVGRR